MDIREEALKLRRKYQGLLEMRSKTTLTTREELSIVYTPGVAEPCKDIKINPDLSFELTCRGNMVGIVTDGTRVLGLGDIGPVAAMPVMEGWNTFAYVLPVILLPPVIRSSIRFQRVPRCPLLFQP